MMLPIPVNKGKINIIIYTVHNLTSIPYFPETILLPPTHTVDVLIYYLGMTVWKRNCFLFLQNEPFCTKAVNCFKISETKLPNEVPRLDSTTEQEGAKKPEEFQIGEEMGKEVLIGGDTDDNRSARGSVRERHLVKTFSEVSNIFIYLALILGNMNYHIDAPLSFRFFVLEQIV